MAALAMFLDPTLPAAAPWPDYTAATLLLWRFMVDRRFQGRGIDAAAIGLLVEHARRRPGMRRFATTYRTGDGSPAGFCRRLGFVPTWRILEDEAEAAMPLD